MRGETEEWEKGVSVPVNDSVLKDGFVSHVTMSRFLRLHTLGGGNSFTALRRKCKSTVNSAVTEI